MPGRFINISLFVALPLLLGFFLRGKKSLLSLVAATVLWAGLMFFSRYSPIPLPLGQREFSLILACILSYLYYRRYGDSRDRQATYSQTNRVLGALVIALVVVSPAFLAYRMPVLRKNFARIQIPSDVGGSVLTTSDRYLLQTEARVPTITPLLDGYAHSGTQSLLWVNRMMGDIYGIPLSASPPPLKRFHAGVIETPEFQELWESRTCADWQQLAGKYRFGLILVPASVHLQLPRIDNDPVWNKYRPVCSVGAGPA